jgi:hypothetical protein
VPAREPEPRSEQLLNAAADALLDGRSPFDQSFLVEHGVTYDECMALSDHLGLLAKAWLRASPDLRSMIAVLGATHEMSDVDPLVLEQMQRGRQAMAELRRTPRRT